MSRSIDVVSGQKKTVVGKIRAVKGMVTNQGRIERVTDVGTIFFEGGARVSSKTQVTVTLTEARRFRYPARDGCIEITHVPVRTRKQPQPA